MTMAADRVELLQIADSVAREKLIPREMVLSSMEEAIERAVRSVYGLESIIKATIHPQNGRVRLFRKRLVVKDKTSHANVSEISFEEAVILNPDIKEGEMLEQDLPLIDFGRVAATAAKQIIIQKIREAEKEQQYKEFENRVGEIVHGVVRSVEHGNVAVSIGNHGDAIMYARDLIGRESFRAGDRARAYIYDVRQNSKGYQVFLSRTHPQFVAKLFAQEVPEVYEGVIEIKGVARDPGSRSKMAVYSRDTDIDPIGACVGMRGNRVQVVVAELQGEKIEIIPWHEDSATFIVNAMAPAQIVKVILDEDLRKVEVVTPEDKLSLALGRRGQNVRLASRLTGWKINILTESEEATRRQNEFKTKMDLFMRALEVDEFFARLLVSEGFTAVEEILYVDQEEFQSITETSAEDAKKIQEKAREFVADAENSLKEECKKLGMTDSFLLFEGLTLGEFLELGKNDISTLEDLAGCVPDDLVGYIDPVTNDKVNGMLESFNIDSTRAQSIIMQARELVGWI